jgi:type IV secretory pathway protease TraF
LNSPSGILQIRVFSSLRGWANYFQVGTVTKAYRASVRFNFFTSSVVSRNVCDRAVSAWIVMIMVTSVATMICVGTAIFAANMEFSSPLAKRFGRRETVGYVITTAAMTGRLIVLGTAAMAVAAIGTTMDPITPRFVWNASASVPIGLYSVHPAHHLTVTALAVAYPAEPLAGWLEERRYLPRGVPLLKPILALDGQTVCRVGPRITVDGREMGIAQDKDHSGRLLPFWQCCRVIGHSESFLMNPHEPASLDGRYFGRSRSPRSPASPSRSGRPRRTDHLASAPLR